MMEQRPSDLYRLLKNLYYYDIIRYLEIRGDSFVPLETNRRRLRKMLSFLSIHVKLSSAASSFLTSLESLSDSESSDGERALSENELYLCAIEANIRLQELGGKSLTLLSTMLQHKSTNDPTIIKLKQYRQRQIKDKCPMIHVFRTSSACLSLKSIKKESRLVCMIDDADEKMFDTFCLSQA